jgi:tRNA modification GTPase
VILAVKQATPTISLELHCHGGIEVVRLLQELYEECGVQVISANQFVSDPILALLARAPTTRTAGILADQADAWLAVTPNSLQRLKELIPPGQHLVQPWKIVIAGAPNVGKSSLLNALAGFTRCIVSPTPGTTRDVVTVNLAIDGWPVEIIDTAGIRQAPCVLEQQGIERALGAAREADLRFWLLDGSETPIFPDERRGWHFLINKTDLPAAWDWLEVPGALCISAQTKTGLAELCDLISRELVPAPPTPGEAVPCLPEHRTFIERLLVKEPRPK